MRTKLLFAAMAASVAVFAQENVGGVPYSIRMGLERASVPTVKTPLFDEQAVAEEDVTRAEQGKLPLYSRFLPLDVDMTNSGIWSVLPNGDQLWRLRIVSGGAQATELYFEDFHLPSGATLFIYDDSGAQVFGGFTTYNNHPSGLFSTAMVIGEASILEYYEPAAVKGEGHFHVANVGHAYRFVGNAKADACEVDVNCSPENIGFTDQKNGVVRVSVVEPGGSGWCSGSVVNNTNNDCTPYILTAYHCGVNSTTANFTNWKFYFRYERPNCGSGSATVGKVMTGCTKKADSNDGGGNSGSDFLLLQTNNQIPINYGPYWNGWDASGTGSTGGKGIHHPAGSEKKISTFTGPAITSSWGAANTHWKVVWAATTNGNGVTEGGSSGSPLFNNDGLIIGTLTGGGSCCTTGGCGANTSLTAPDYYGKMSKHWQGNPGSSSEYLMNWLAPGSSLTVLAGSYDPCGNFLSTQEIASAPAPDLFPNPATDRVTVVYPQDVVLVDRIDVMDVSGRVVLSQRPTSSGSAVLHTEGLIPGAYIVKLLAGDVTYAGAKVNITGR